MKTLVSAIVLAVVACTSAPSPQVLHAQYQFTASYPLGSLSPNDPFRVMWSPKLVRTSASEPYEVRLCVALFGPYASVELLKQSLSGTGGNECPPAGAVVASETLRTRSDDDHPLAADLKLPTAAGFYAVSQIAISGSDRAGSVASGGGIIEIRSR